VALDLAQVAFEQAHAAAFSKSRKTPQLAARSKA